MAKWPDSVSSLSQQLTHDGVLFSDLATSDPTALSNFFDMPLNILTSPASAIGLQVFPAIGGTAVPGPDLLRFGTFQMTMKIERIGGTW